MGTRVVPFLLLAACLMVALHGFFGTTFVSNPRSAAASAVRDDVAQAAALPVFATLMAPGVAEAATQEQQLNRFGFGFAIFYLCFFIAGLFRIFTQGKL